MRLVYAIMQGSESKQQRVAFISISMSLLGKKDEIVTDSLTGFLLFSIKSSLTCLANVNIDDIIVFCKLFAQLVFSKIA
jgi:hypothetical protein